MSNRADPVASHSRDTNICLLASNSQSVSYRFGYKRRIGPRIYQGTKFLSATLLYMYLNTGGRKDDWVFALSGVTESVCVSACNNV